MMYKKASAATILIIFIIIIILAGIAFFVFIKAKPQEEVKRTDLAKLYISGKHKNEYKDLNLVTASNYLKDGDFTASFKIIENFTSKIREEREYSPGDYTIFSWSDDCYVDKSTVIVTPDLHLKYPDGYELNLDCIKKSKININITKVKDEGNLKELLMSINQEEGRLYFPTICFRWSQNIIYSKIKDFNSNNLANKKDCENFGGYWKDEIYRCNLFCKIKLSSPKLIEASKCVLNNENAKFDSCYENQGTWDSESLNNYNYSIEYKTTGLLRDYDYLDIYFLDKDRDVNLIESDGIRKFYFYNSNGEDLGIKNIDFHLSKDKI